MAEMNAERAAKILTSSVNIQGPVKIVTDELISRAVAVDCLRKVVAGELREVVHGEWIADEFGHKCSVCGEYVGDDTYENECLTYCPNCGNPMDGKDGSNEKD